MIVVNHLRKKFIKTENNKKIDFYAVDDVTFNVDDGEIIGVLGPNGAGKSTLLRMLVGTLRPTSGKIEIDNLNYDDNEIDIRKKLTFLSCNTKLYETLTPHELLKICGDFYFLTKEEFNKREKELIEKLRLNRIINQKIKNLSTGEFQKIGLARCMIADPQYYILDEATTGLDVVTTQIVLDFIKSEKERGKTILYSTHHMDEADLICDKLLLINNGKIVAFDTIDKIKEMTTTDNLRDAFFKLIGGVTDEK